MTQHYLVTTNQDLHMQSELIITTNAGIKLTLKPVPMTVLPSDYPALWLKFQGSHIPGGALPEETIDKVQRFMRQHRTEALTDGQRNLTIAGPRLAVCFPENV
jgi:hypothetical protein